MGLDAGYAAYPGYPPPGALALIEEQLYLERCGMLRGPPLYPPAAAAAALAGAYLPYMLPAPHLAYMHERLKMEEEQRQRQQQQAQMVEQELKEREREQREREKEQQRERELQREREQRDKERREREKAVAAAAAAAHHPRFVFSFIVNTDNR